MIDFIYNTPTKVVFGKDGELQAGALCREFGAEKVLVHYGGSSAKKSGVLDRVIKSLEEAGLPYVTLGGVQPNPVLSLVYKGIELCRRENVDFILAVGGGSVIDSAKGIGYGIPYEGDVWDFFIGAAQAKVRFPIGCVPTIAAAGSETSNSCVLTKDDTREKLPYNVEEGRPRFAIMNPELTYTVSDYQTQCGCVDILMHTLERYLTRERDTELTDSIGEALLRTVMHHAKILRGQPRNYNSRAQVMWAGSLSHNGLTGCGTIGDYASHRIQHELGGMFDVAHGAGLAAVWPSWARYVYRDCPGRFMQLGVNVLGIPGDYFRPEKTAVEAIDRLENFFVGLGMPITLKQLVGRDVTDAEIEELADRATRGDTITLGNFKVLRRADVKRIYEMARQTDDD